MVSNDLVAKTVREKSVSGDAVRIIGWLDDLKEIWETLDTCYERPEKQMAKALRPILDFRRYKVYNTAVREFYSLLRATIKGARVVGHIGLLINNQTITKIMGKMPFTDWKEWATRRPEWIHENVENVFEKFVDQKWKDVLNVAAAEPGG
jgi:hypothetical protein